jgi:hypothetical protein
MSDEYKTGEDTSTAEFLESLVIAKEKLKKEKPKEKEEKREAMPEIRPKAKAPLGPLPPIYRRALPPLPAPPKYVEAWPLPPPPRPAARPPEAEAFAPQIRPIPEPTPLAIQPPRPMARPVIIRPVAGAAPKLDLNRLNSLIADDTITTIQCDGANLPLKIIKERRTEEIDLVLSEEEIRNIIRAFSAASGQPVTEPIFTALANSLQISAQISVFQGTKFVIKKI